MNLGVSAVTGSAKWIESQIGRMMNEQIISGRLSQWSTHSVSHDMVIQVIGRKEFGPIHGVSGCGSIACDVMT